MRNRLTERELTRLIKQVINNSNSKKFILKEDCVKSMAQIDPKTGKPAYIDSKTGKYCDPCKEQLKKLRNDPTYSQVIKKMKEYALLEWWEWYDKLNLQLTHGETMTYVEYIKKEIEILKGCPSTSRYSEAPPTTDRLGAGGSFERGY